jgi:integration host factor subunit beta
MIVRRAAPLETLMTKADLVENVTARIARTAGPTISKKDCARVVDAFLDAIKDALAEQKNIEVRGFGTFKIRQRKTRMARNPRTGSPVEVSARPVPVFKPSKELRTLVADADEALELAEKAAADAAQRLTSGPMLDGGPR